MAIRREDIYVELVEGSQEFLSVASVARTMAIAPATLRTWDRRYGLGPSEHEVGRHRRYSEADVTKLLYMRRLIISGVVPAEAAEMAKNYTGARIELGNVAPLQQRDELVTSLFRAAYGLDERFLEDALSQSFADDGVVKTWHEVVVPLMVKIGEEWERTDTGVEVEHLLSETVQRCLHRIELKSAVNTRPVVLAAVSEEQHSLVLLAVKASLAEKGIASYYLGARTPGEAINAIVSRVGPPAIFLWALLPENADPHIFQNLPKVRPAPRILLGGSGWDRDACAGAQFVDDLASTCEEISRAVGL